MSELTNITPPDLSIVIPVYNERANLSVLLARLWAATEPVDLSFEVLFVDDGSTDDTSAELCRLAESDPRIRWLRLSRNFGHQAALVAGLAHAASAAVITMDGDLQHPPELIPELIARWRAGTDVVQAVRREPADHSALKRAGSRGFYRLLSSVSRINVTPGAADFRLMSREAVDAFIACGERCRFNRGLVQWIGFTCVELPYEAQPRHAGRSKYSYRAMVRLAGDAIFSFSSLPLRLAGLAGVGVSLAAAAYLLFVLWARVFTERTVPGWSSILATVLVLGGVNLIVLWILGEYVGRLYEEVKQRPIYIVRARSEKNEICTTSTPSLESHTPNRSRTDSSV
ncbi:MAG: glycosyltransferase family 2 protein [Planctomycetota bacterium]